MEKLLRVLKAVKAYGLFSSLYFAQGVPGGFIAGALLYYLQNVEKTMTKQDAGKFLAVVGIPWVFKALWGPLVDKWALFWPKVPRFSWVVASTVVMVLALLMLMGQRDLTFIGLVAVVLCHNLGRSFQDVGTDGMAVTLLREEERGLATTAMRASAYFGSMIGGAGGIWLLGQKVPWSVICLLVAALVVIFGLIVPWFMLKGKLAAAANGNVVEVEVVESQQGWRDTLSQFRPMFWGVVPIAAICMGLLAHTAESLTAPMMNPWFAKGLGYDENYVAFLDACGNWAKIGGTVLGGGLAAMISVRLAFGLVVVFKVCAYATLGLMAAYWGSKGMIFGMLMMTSIADGAAVVIITALFMGVTVRWVAASHFAVLMAAMNLSNTWASWVGGGLADSLGEKSMFIMGGTAQLLILIPLLFVRPDKVSAK